MPRDFIQNHIIRNYIDFSLKENKREKELPNPTLIIFFTIFKRLIQIRFAITVSMSEGDRPGNNSFLMKGRKMGVLFLVVLGK